MMTYLDSGSAATRRRVWPRKNFRQPVEVYRSHAALTIVRRKHSRIIRPIPVELVTGNNRW